jgi:4-amino-4-deoxy-L-arabinose transferase-like glycosyltransferase
MPLALRPAFDWRLLPLLLLPFIALGTPPLFDLDEGAFTASTLEMFLRGDFLSSYLLGEPRHDKPILVYWLQALSVSVFGFEEWAWRLPSSLAAAAWIGLTHAFVARLADRDTALTAALVVATAAGLVIIQRAATADALLNLWLAAAGYAAWLWLKEGKPAWRYASHAAMALGFLTKGPIAIVVPAGAVLLWCVSRRAPLRFLRWFMEWRALALFLAIAAPWFVVQTWLEGPGFLAGFFLKHNVERFGSAMEGHGGNPLYYLPVVLLSLLPHTGLLLAAVWRVRTVWRDELTRYGLIWFGLVFVLFSLSGTKLPHYVYYGYGGLVLVMARQVEATPRWLLLLPGTLMFALLLALPELLASQLPRLKPDDRLLAAGLDGVFGHAYWLWFGGALVFSLALFALPRAPLRLGLSRNTPGRPKCFFTPRGGAGWAKPGPGGLYTNGILAALGLVMLLIPAVGEVQQGPIRQAGRLAAGLAGPLVMYGVNTPSFQTYAGRQVHRRPPWPGDLVLTRESHLKDLPGAEVIYRERSYVLVRLAAAGGSVP